MKECSCVNLFSEKIFSLPTCKVIFQFGHEKFRLGPAHLGGYSTMAILQACYGERNVKDA